MDEKIDQVWINNTWGSPSHKTTYQPIFQLWSQTLQWRQIQLHHILLHTAMILTKY